MDENKCDFSEQEQQEVSRLFAEFAARELIEPKQVSEPELEQPQPEAPPAPTKKRLSRRAIIALGLVAALCIGLTVWLLFPKQQTASAHYTTLSAGNHYVMAVKNDGTIYSLSGEFTTLGSMTLTPMNTDVQAWQDIVSISTSTMHALGLKKDGTVVSTGFFYPDKIPISTSSSFVDTYGIDVGQANVTDWKNMIAVSAGYKHSVGLRADGTVVAVGDNSFGQCDVDKWRDIIAISAGSWHTVGLKKDGTVVATKIPEGENDSGQCNVSTWTDIVSITAGDSQTFGVRADGTVVAAGVNDRGQCNVATWTEIIAIASGIYHTVGLRKDGTVVATATISNPIYDYGVTKVDDWTDIVAVAATNSHTIGLKTDGTVVFAGLHTSTYNQMSSWTDVRIP